MAGVKRKLKSIADAGVFSYLKNDFLSRKTLILFSFFFLSSYSILNVVSLFMHQTLLMGQTSYPLITSWVNNPWITVGMFDTVFYHKSILKF